MDLGIGSSSIDKDLQNIMDKFTPMVTKFGAHTFQVNTARTENSVRQTVDSFLQDMEKLGQKLQSKQRSLEEPAKAKLQAMVDKFDDLRDIGRTSGSALFDVSARMSQIYAKFGFNS